MITFQENFEYDTWANQESLKWIMNNEQNDRVQLLFSHILNAQHLWTHRIMKKQTKHGVWDVHSNEVLNDLLIENGQYLQFVDKNYSPEEIISYTNSKGESYQNKVSDILFHVFNHGNYHRGQMNMVWRKLEIDPPYIDHIHWKREITKPNG